MSIDRRVFPRGEEEAGTPVEVLIDNDGIVSRFEAVLINHSDGGLRMKCEVDASFSLGDEILVSGYLGDPPIKGEMEAKVVWVGSGVEINLFGIEFLLPLTGMPHFFHEFSDKSQE